MPKRKEAIKYAKVGEKDLWHPYGLQGLTADRFAKVVNRILTGRIGLLVRRSASPMQG
jgi:hypothetical protein